jgi:uroporphyrinogen decarboxylase
VSGIVASTYHRLKQQLGIISPNRVADVYEMLAEVERPVMERFGADVVSLCGWGLETLLAIQDAHWKPWRLFDGTPVEVPAGFNPVREKTGDWVLLREGIPIARMPEGGFYFDLIEDSPALEKSPGAVHVNLDDYRPHLLTLEELRAYHARAEALYQNTDFAIVVPLEPPFQLFRGMGTGGFEAWLVTLATEPDYVHALMERVTSAWLGNLERLAEAVGERGQIFQTYDDLGTQNAPFLSVKMFRELIMPYYKRTFDWIHQNTKWKVLFHSDGAICPLIPSLIEMGVDALNPVQISAHNMEATRLKQEFGDKLAFWGGACDCQHTLPFGTPQDVAREVKENVRVLGRGGGYVCAAVHNIQAGVPPENVVALFDTARHNSLE